MILANASPGRSRMNRLLVLTIAVIAFAFGGFATFGVMKVAQFFQSDAPVAVAESATPEVETAEVTRTTPQALLALPVDISQRPNPRPVVPVIAPIEIAPVVIAPVEEPVEVLAITPVVAPAPLPFIKPVARPVPVRAVEPDLTLTGEIETLAAAATLGTYDLIAEDNGAATRIVLHFRADEPTANLLRQKAALAVDAGQLDATYAQIAGGQGVDTQVLLFQLIQTQLAAGDQSGIRAARVLRQKAFAASDARTALIDGAQIYTVRAGDSLAYIALQLYGTPQSASQILKANRATLTSASQLEVGMQLVIPNA